MELGSKLHYYAKNPKQVGSAVTFIAWAAWQRVLRSSRACPHCGSARTVSMGRRTFVLTLMRCEECFLKFRYPKQPEGWSEWFYQRTDTSGDELPEVGLIQNLVNQKFVGSIYDAERVTAVLMSFKIGRVLDYGCSWGYNLWQFGYAGYDAIGFEIAKPKALFGTTTLGVKIISDYQVLESLEPSSFDFVIASHVLEHLPKIDSTLRLFSRLIRPRGKLVVLVPNAASQLAQQWRGVWPYMISREHNLALDAAWFHRNIGCYGFTPLFSSAKFGKTLSLALAPYDEAESECMGRLLDEELMMVATRQ